MIGISQAFNEYYTSKFFHFMLITYFANKFTLSVALHLQNILLVSYTTSFQVKEITLHGKRLLN